MKQYAITGRGGMYYGTAPTRRQAIAQHVWATDQDCYEAGYPVSSKPLNDAQKRAWAVCKKRGDKAIKVIVTPAD